MPSINETVYPRFKSIINESDLKNIYTPTPSEILYANEMTRNQKNRLQFLIMLKTHQRLGYFVNSIEVPKIIINHIARSIGIENVELEYEKYDKSLTRLNHLNFIRKYLNVKPYDKNANHIAIKAAAEAAETKDNDADIINVVIDELIHQRYELPAFSTLVRLSRKVRHAIYTSYYKHVYEHISDNTKQLIDKLFNVSSEDTKTGWNVLKENTGKITPNNLSHVLEVLESIKAFNIKEQVLLTIPDVKIKHFVCAAAELDASKMKELEEYKRYTLAVAYISQRCANIIDDVGEMFVKLVKARQNKARDKQIEYRLSHTKIACNLITTLRDIMLTYKTEGDKEERFNAIDQAIKIGNIQNPDEIIDKCEIHNTYAGDNYYPFAWDCLKGKCRTTLFKVLDNVELYSTTQDKTMEAVIKIIKKYRNSGRLEKIAKEEFRNIDLSWISENWTKLLADHTGKVNSNDSINRRHFEACAFYEIMQDLKSGDLCIKGSDKFSDYREQLISWEEYNQQIKTYGEQVGIPVTETDFVEHVKVLLNNVDNETDKSFTSNQYLRIQKGEPILTPLKKKIEPQNLNSIKDLLAQRMEQVSILDILYTSQQWYNWTKFFGPLSGFDSKLDDPIERYLTTVFCYGCNLGPSQTANSLDVVSRKQISYINQWHISSDKLDNATTHIVNLYKKFNIIKYWGTGERAAADGTIWEIFERNLLSEKHIRYGVNGAIGYYHVSDLYIALFNRFIPCGVWEGVYILDLLMNEDINIKPNILHSDTQGQNEPIFGLSFLLGIDLMPRIRNWKNLKFYKLDKTKVYEHIDELFTDNIDWELIKTYLPDMLRVAISIKMGKITPSTILRKLGSYSRKNKLYQAFSELGRAIRSEFLLKYISDIDLRRTIQESTNKCESFNGFTKWINFGSDGVIRENNRDEQSKMIKYNQLVANSIIFYNVYHMSIILQNLASEGYEINEDILSSLSPYMTGYYIIIIYSE